MEYHKRYYSRSIAGVNNKIEIIRLLLINSLEAAGSNPPLDAKRKCIENIMQNINCLKNKNNFTFDDFISCFVDSNNKSADIKKLRDALARSSKFPHLGVKKSNLFLKELVLLAGSNIFANFKKQKYIKHLEVPVDKVIRMVYYRLKNKKHVNNNKKDSEIQKFAKELFPDNPIFFDDVWFWGHFTIERNNFAGINEAKLVSDKYLDQKYIERKQLRKKFKEFTNLINR